MGQTGSRVFNKISSSFTFHGSPTDDPFDLSAATTAVASFKGTPFVYYRRR
jgi:hypothetical protein